MNITANNVASKLFVAFVAAAMLFTLATPAKAATAEELQAQIDALMAQIAALKGDTATTPKADSAACTFTRALTVGSQGADVKCLQDYLTPKYFTNAGGSTGYFGSVTAAAVAAWQTANGVTPAAGYFGPVSQAKYTALMATTPDTDDSDSDDEDTDSAELSGEASLDNVEVADGEDADDVEEGSEDVQVAEITVEFADGDAMITRLDIALDATTDGNDDVDPWDTFEEVSLWVDGDEVAREDASDEDNYLDEDLGTMRFSGLDITAMEDEEVTIVVAVSVGNSVDGVSDGADWDVAATGLRFVDADDVTSTETSAFDLQTAASSYSADSAEFTIDEAGAGDDLDLESSNEDPEATTFALDEDDNTEEAIFAFDLSADDSDGDIDLNEVQVEVFVLGDGTSVDTLVNDFRLEIGDDSFDAESYTGTGSSTILTFDIDGDVTVEADDMVTAMLYADFENMDNADLEGSQIYATTSAVGIDAEGVEDVTVDGGNITGETHTLRTEGLDVTKKQFDVNARTIDGSDNDYGEYEIEVDITAFGETLYIANTGVAAFTYQIENSAGSAVTNSAANFTATSSTISSDADVQSGYYRIDADETETFTFRVTVNPVAGGEGVDYRVQFLTVIFNDTADAVTPSSETLTPASQYETGFALISD